MTRTGHLASSSIRIATSLAKIHLGKVARHLALVDSKMRPCPLYLLKSLTELYTRMASPEIVFCGCPAIAIHPLQISLYLLLQHERLEYGDSDQVLVAAKRPGRGPFIEPFQPILL